jgi:hypothetical protein
MVRVLLSAKSLKRAPRVGRELDTLDIDRMDLIRKDRDIIEALERLNAIVTMSIFALAIRGVAEEPTYSSAQSA